MIKLNAYGGLGNQLFQLFHAYTCYHQPVSINAYHADKFSTVREFELQPLLNLNDVNRDGYINRLQKSKLPRLYQRITHRPLRLGSNIYLDGYFQDLSWYSGVIPDRTRKFIDELRSVLGVNEIVPGGTLVHIRLTDFFSDEKSQRDYAKKKLQSLGECSIITDRDDIIEHLIHELNLGEKIQLKRSHGLDAWAVIKMFASFQAIHTNGSTLAFWGSIAANSKLITSRLDHQALREEI